MPGVKAQNGGWGGDERVGSGKWAVEGLRDTRKHLNPDGGRQAGEKGQIANGAETGIRWKTGEEPKLEVLLLGA